MKNNIKKSSSARGGKTKIQHTFRGIREPVMTDAASNTVLSVQVAANNTSVVGQAMFNPAGLYACPLTVSGSNVVTGEPRSVSAPPLRWLFTTSANFGKYRVTRASLIFVGNQGSTMTGTMVVTAFKDVLDAGIVPQNAYAVGPNAKTFDIASSSTKEIRIPVPVDTSWKKVTKALNTGLASPFQDRSTNFLISVNSANDLCFGAFSFNAYGTPNLSQAYSLGTFFLDYDVEFGEPESISLNV